MFRVLTRTLFGWEDCWHEDDEPARFDTREEAQAEIDEHLESCRLKNQRLSFNEDDFVIEDMKGKTRIYS